MFLDYQIRGDAALSFHLGRYQRLAELASLPINLPLCREHGRFDVNTRRLYLFDLVGELADEIGCLASHLGGGDACGGGRQKAFVGPQQFVGACNARRECIGQECSEGIGRERGVEINCV